MMSSYNYTPHGKQKSFNKRKKGENQEEAQNIKNKLKQNIQRSSIWNQHTYDVGIWTKEKIDSKINGKQSLTSIVNRTPKQNSYPRIINSGQESSLSSLSQNNYKPRKKKKDKVNEYIKTNEHRLNKNVSHQQITNNNSRPTRQNKKVQLGSDSTSGKSYNMNSEQNYIQINKTSSPKDTEFKRLKIFTDIYNPNKQSLSPIGTQTESTNSPNHQTTQPHQHTSFKATNQPKRVNEKRRNKIPHSKSITNLPIISKQQKMNAFGFKSGSKSNDYQKNNFTPIETTIQPTLESLQKSQINDYFGDKLSTKLIENLRIINLSINGLDLGKGKHSLLQLCSNLQDKGADLLCLTETKTNWHRQYLVQKFSATLKTA